MRPHSDAQRLSHRSGALLSDAPALGVGGLLVHHGRLARRANGPENVWTASGCERGEKTPFSLVLRVGDGPSQLRSRDITKCRAKCRDPFGSHKKRRRSSPTSCWEVFSVLLGLISSSSRFIQKWPNPCLVVITLVRRLEKATQPATKTQL